MTTATSNVWERLYASRNTKARPSAPAYRDTLDFALSSTYNHHTSWKPSIGEVLVQEKTLQKSPKDRYA
jgi:hypothetical protein